MQNIVSDIFMVDEIDKTKSKCEITKHRDYEGKAISPFSFGFDVHPEYPDRVVLTFSETKESEINPKHIEEMVGLVDEMAGAGGEVLRKALWAVMVSKRGWGKGRFNRVLPETERLGLTAKVQRGEEVAYYIPKGLKGSGNLHGNDTDIDDF